MKNLFVLKKQTNQYSISKGLINSNDYISNKFNDLGIKTKVVIVNDDNAIDKEIHKYLPCNVFIEAIWCRPSKLKELALKYPKVRFSVRVHSKFPFLSNEGIALDWLNQYRDLSKDLTNIGISANNEKFCFDLSKVLRTNVDYLPNMYFPHDHIKIKKSAKCDKNTNQINISSFCSIRPLKNLLEQAVSAIIFGDIIGKKIIFHVNSDRVEQGGEATLKNLHNLFAGNELHELKEHPWMNYNDLIKVQSTMDLAMGVSLSESFMLTLADAIYCGVPAVTSQDVDWAPEAYRAIPTDTEDIVAKLLVTYELPNVNVRLCKKALDKHNKKAVEVWERYLGNYEIHGI